MPSALIVEDEPEANHLLAMLVQLRGYRTHSAYTGEEALEKVDLDPPDIVFLDLMLPDINGYEVCRTLKARKETSLIPVVMVTARVANENRLQSYKAGASDYIPKPYTPEQIFQAMADADSWRRELERQNAEGAIALALDDDGDALRQIAQLRCLLLGRTPLEVDAVTRIAGALKEIQARAETWGGERRKREVAMLSYRLDAESVIITLRDNTGFLASFVRDEAWSRLVVPSFDEAIVENDGHQITLLKSLPGDNTVPSL